MTIIKDELKSVRSWKLEIYGQNPLIEDWLEDKLYTEKKIVRQFITFLSDTYPDIRSVLFGPPKSVEEREET
jgi:hypothetical protein